MNKYNHKLTIGIAMILACATPWATSSCEDRFENEESNEPQWLGPNIYDYLAQRGDCKYFCRLIEDCGYYETLKRTGSNTLFFSADATFEAFFNSDEGRSRGITSYEKIPQSLKYQIIKTSLLENAQLIERLGVGDHGGIVFRRTTMLNVSDTVPLVSYDEMPHNKYFEPYKNDTLRLLSDASRWTLVQFFPDVIHSLKLTDGDMRYICGEGASTDSTYLFQSRIIKKDITCKNGYLHELDRLNIVPENMARYISTNSDLSTFSRLMNRFCLPVPYSDNNGVNTYELRYFNESTGNPLTIDINGKAAEGLLYFDPAWNLYQNNSAVSSTQAAYESDMAAMFVPTDEAMNRYFSSDPDALGYDIYTSFAGCWDSVPSSICAEIVKNHQMTSFASAVPSRFESLKDMAGYDWNLSESDIVGSYVGRNGIVYIIDKVMAPQDFLTVMGPAKIDQSMKVFNLALSDSYCQFQYYLRSPKSKYHFFITPDTYLTGYQDPISAGYSGVYKNSYWNLSYNADKGVIQAAVINANTGDTLKYNTSGGINGSLTSHLTDILNQQTYVESDTTNVNMTRDVLTPGRTWYITKGYAPMRVVWRGGEIDSVAGAGNVEALKVTQSFTKSNGKAHVLNGIMQPSTTSIYATLRSHAGASVTGSIDDRFKRFYDMCYYCGFFVANPTTTTVALDRHVSFLNQYHYTIYVPTNSAIEQAITDGVVPSIEDIKSCSETEKRDSLTEVMNRFLRYHFQDYSIFINGRPEQDEEYYSQTLNLHSNKFYRLRITQDGETLSVTDNLGQTVRVSSTLCNIPARDIIVVKAGLDSNDAGIETYSYAVIHQLEDGKYLRFE